MKKLLALALLLGFVVSAQGQKVDDSIFQSVSSTTLEEKELTALLDEMRKVETTDLNLLSFSSISSYVRASLNNLLRTWSLSHFRAIGLVLELDDSLKPQYMKEASQLEDALKDNRFGINKKNSEGLTPLHLAIINNKPSDIIVPLLASGADIYAVDKKGLTPEHYAAKQCLLDTDLDIVLPSGGVEHVWGIFANTRSCWAQRTLAAERRQRQGGIGRLYDWLERGRHYLPDPETLQGVLAE